jgi:integrase/recombinase XerD
VSEAVGLDVDDLHIITDTGQTERHDPLALLNGKGGKQRFVPVGSYAVRALEAYLVRGRPVLARHARKASPAVFLNARGGRLTRQGAWLIVRAAGDRAGLQGRLFPHVLRHSCATHMLDRGADIRVVQELLGHASLSTTQVYTKVSPERLRAVYEAAHPRARAGNRGPAREGRQ